MDRNNAEKRSFPRFISNLPVVINADDFELRTETKNISCSGLFCEIGRYIPKKTKLKVMISLPVQVNNHQEQKELNCPAEVSRIIPDVANFSGNYNIGIVFSRITDKDRSLILKFVHQRNLKEAKEIKKIYLQLKDMAARLVELEECHPTAEHFHKVINKAIGELDAVAHILDYEINELKTME